MFFLLLDVHYNINNIWSTSYIFTSLCVLLVFCWWWLRYFWNVFKCFCWFFLVDISADVSWLCSIIFQFYFWLKSFLLLEPSVVTSYMQIQLCAKYFLFALEFHISYFLDICVFLRNPLKNISMKCKVGRIHNFRDDSVFFWTIESLIPIPFIVLFCCFGCSTMWH